MGKNTVRNIGQKRLSKWLDEMVKENAVPVMVIGLIDDGRMTDVDIWTLKNMRTIDMRNIIQRIIEKIYILEIEKGVVTKCIHGQQN